MVPAPLHGERDWDSHPGFTPSERSRHPNTGAVGDRKVRTVAGDAKTGSCIPPRIVCKPSGSEDDAPTVTRTWRVFQRKAKSRAGSLEWQRHRG